MKEKEKAEAGDFFLLLQRSLLPIDFWSFLHLIEDKVEYVFCM